MRKLLLLSIAVLALFKSNAQITITQNDFPSIGDIWVSYSDGRVNVHTITPAGPNQSWNYANAFLVNDTTALSFILPSATPAGWATGFPNATHAIYSPQDTLAQYFMSQTNGFYLDGLYFGAQGGTVPEWNYNPDQLVVPTPFTYNSNRLNTSLLTIDFPAAPPLPATRMKQTKITGFLGDAWGSLITPAGTFPSTLRIRQASVSVDSTFIDLMGNGVYTFLQSSGFTDTSITYTWLKNGSGALLMTIDVNSTTTQTDGAEYYVLGPVGLPEQMEMNNVLVYPNPAIDFINFELNDNTLVEIRIFNCSGQLVRTENVKGINRLMMSTNGLNQGIYTFYLTDTSGKVKRKGKFMVAR